MDQLKLSFTQTETCGGAENPQNLCAHTCLHNEMKDVSETVGHWILVCCQMRRMINLFFSNSVTQMTDYLITISCKYA